MSKSAPISKGSPETKNESDDASYANEFFKINIDIVAAEINEKEYIRPGFRFVG